MNCRHIQALLDGMDSVNDPTGPAAFLTDPDWQRHLNTCETCRKMVDEVLRPLAFISTVEAPPLPGMKRRTLQRMAPAGPVAGALRPLVTTVSVCLIFLAGYWFRGVVAPSPHHAPPHHSFQLHPSQTTTPACFQDTVWPFNPAAMYQTPPTPHSNHALTLYDAMEVGLPENLATHGPYALVPDRIRIDDTGACIPFVSPFGDAVTLHMSRIRKSDDSPPETGYVLHEDPQRIMFYTVSWIRDGWLFRMAGRVPADYLLDLAREFTITV